MPKQSNMFGQSQRLIYRKITIDDFDEIYQMMNTKSVKEVWEQNFSKKDIINWIKKCKNSYCQEGLGFYIIQDKENSNVVGQVSLSDDEINGNIFYEIGYILHEKYTKKGYATEAAKFMAQFAFDKLNLEEVIFEIRPNNIASIKVATPNEICSTLKIALIPPAIKAKIKLETIFKFTWVTGILVIT